MVRTSVPCSRRCTANACLRECGVIGLQILQIRWAFWHSRSTAPELMCWPGISLGKSQCSVCFRQGCETRVQTTSDSRTISCNAACVLRKKEIHVISDAIAEVMADGAHTI